MVRAILGQDIQTLLDRQGGIEDDETKTEWEDIVAGANLEEVADGTLVCCCVSQDSDGFDLVTTQARQQYTQYIYTII